MYTYNKCIMNTCVRYEGGEKGKHLFNKQYQDRWNKH